MTYKINELAKIAGVSVRTLHYYDEIALLRPSGILKNGYRFYEKPELLRLQQILFYRELEFSLDEIKKILDDPGFSSKRALKDHKHSIEQKKKRMDELIKTINKTIKHMENKNQINDEELYDPFRDKDVNKYQGEVKLRWGNSEAYKQSMARVKRMTKAEMDKMKKDGKAFTQKIADNMNKGADHEIVQELIAAHYKSIQFFYDCPLDMYRNLGKMYVNDHRFATCYDKFAPGLAVFMRDAILVFCNNKKNS